MKGYFDCNVDSVSIFDSQCFMFAVLLLWRYICMQKCARAHMLFVS